MGGYVTSHFEAFINHRKWMTSIVIDEGTSSEKLYMGGGFNSALGPTSLERYPKLLAVYDANAKTWRLYITFSLIPEVCDHCGEFTELFSGKTVKSDHFPMEGCRFFGIR